MALLPLAGPRTEDNAGHMDVRSYFSAIATVARRVQVTVGEMQYAADRARQLKLSEGESDRAPDTYAEFLLRTSGTLMREPSARCRGPRGLGSAPPGDRQHPLPERAGRGVDRG